MMYHFFPDALSAEFSVIALLLIAPVDRYRVPVDRYRVTERS